MDTFGRGCLYCIVGVLVVFLFAFIAQTTINIPWFIFIPLVILAFYVASKKNSK